MIRHNETFGVLFNCKLAVSRNAVLHVNVVVEPSSTTEGKTDSEQVDNFSYSTVEYIPLSL